MVIYELFKYQTKNFTAGTPKSINDLCPQPIHMLGPIDGSWSKQRPTLDCFKISQPGIIWSMTHQFNGKD